MVGPDGPRQGAAPIPDFSGIWAHLTWPDFEPPLAGLGPVTNRSRRGEAGNNYELVGDHTNPILKPHAAEVVKRHGEISLTGVPYPTPSNQCWPGGMPFVLWNIGMQMLQKPDIQFTVEDPGVFTMPWSAGITYRRPLGDWPEMVCAETTHTHFAGEERRVPSASKPDF